MATTVLGATIQPWHDVPLHGCDGGIGPLVTRAEHPRGGEYDERYRLVCLGCGDGVEGTDEQVARAERARDAWTAEKDAGRA